MPSSEEHEQVLAEELEVLQSIYIDELDTISPHELRIRIEPDDEIVPSILSLGLPPGHTAAVPDPSSYESKPLQLSLRIRYGPSYPDEPPDMRIFLVRDVKGVLGPATEFDLVVPPDSDTETLPDGADNESVKELLSGLQEVAQDSLGMAMVFTLASHLRDSLTTLIQHRLHAAEAEQSARRDAEIEAEAEKFRGTAVTPERFALWRRTFEAEQRRREQSDEDARMAKMSSREREEYRKAKLKPSGRQMFERGGSFVEEEEEEEGGQEVDWSLYTREQREREREREREEVEEGMERVGLEEGEE